ncbi:OstA-like protein [Chitinophagaceae bacterium MMS25-I14]
MAESTRTSFSKTFQISCITWCMIFFMLPAKAQQKKDTSNTVFIEILGNDHAETFSKGDTQLTKLIRNVQLKQGTTTMFCDSAYMNLEANTVEAFGSVKIIQPGGTQVQSDYLRYIGNTKMAYLKGNVSLTDGKANLWCEELYYNTGTKIGNYEQGGTLQNESTTVSSNTGTYNVNTKEARFTGEVFVTDPQYNVTSDDLSYNTQTKISQFFAPSIITSDKSEVRTSNGTWDGTNQIAHLVSRSSVQNEAQYIEADKIDYNKKSGLGHAEGRVVSIDTTQKTTLFCGIADYNERSRKLKAFIKPVMRKMNGKDSLFIRADTFFSAPVPKPVDTLKNKQATIKGQKGKPGSPVNPAAPGTENQKKRKSKAALPEKGMTMSVTDTADADSTAPRYFIAFHHVLIFSDSMQGRCDSLSYSMQDSTMRMMYAPVAWFRQSQVTGDTILMFMDSSKLKRVYIPNNALIISRSGPVKANMFDQVQGKTLTGNLVNNTMHDMLVWPNAESIYYPKDEKGAYLGVDQSQSEKMRVLFKDEGISRIILEQEVKQTMSPLTKINITDMRLSRFKWLDDIRPKSLSELFE